MVKRLMLLVTFALVVGLALPAFAEVQDIKVSGDITILGIMRNNLSLGEDVGQSVPIGKQNKKDDNVSQFATITRIRLDANLTDMVSAVIRLSNERDWDAESTSTDTADTDIVLDLAYVVMQEFFYSPLTLTIGRQELHFGNDLIVGDPDTNNQTSAKSTFSQDDLSAKKSFDAVRATLDYNPLVIDLVYAKIQENTVFGATSTPEKDDRNLFGVQARYDFGGDWQTVGELYVWKRVDQLNNTGAAAGDKKKEEVATYGVRVETNPSQRLYLSFELAKQNGKKRQATGQDLDDHKAWAYQGIARYALDMKYDPVLMAVLSYYSGDTDTTEGSQSRGWDPMYENQTNGHIINFLFNQSNTTLLDLRSTLTPLDDTTLAVDLVLAKLNKPYTEGDTFSAFRPDHSVGYSQAGTGKKYLGKEIDIALTHNYTEDVVLGLLYGFFLPGDAFSSKADPINELIASCRVNF